MAQYNLGICYEYSKGTKKSYIKAFYWYGQSAQQGYASAQCNLGYCYDYGHGVDKNSKRAFYWYELSAKQGNAYAQADLSYCYSHGTGVKIDYEKDFYWASLSAKQNCPLGLNNLGSCYEDGRGVEKDFNKAFELYEKAANMGLALAQKNLGQLYQYGQGTEKDFNKALYWYEKSANNGDEKGQYCLGNCYIDGIGTEIDNDKAFYWYSKSAEQNYRNALYSVGKCYHNGIGVDKNEDEALKWYLKAANQNYKDAYKPISNIYADKGELLLSDAYRYMSEGVKRKMAFFNAAYNRYNAFTLYSEKALVDKLINNLKIAVDNGAIEVEKLIELVKDKEQERKLSIKNDSLSPYNCFISFNHNDEVFASAINKVLVDKGLKVYFSNTKDVGDEQKKILKNVSRCNNFICIMSTNSYNSKWVKDELQKALDNKVNIFGIVLDINRSDVINDINQKLRKSSNNHPMKKVYDDKNCKFVSFDEYKTFKENNSLNDDFVMAINDFLVRNNAKTLLSVYQNKIKNANVSFNSFISSSIERNNVDHSSLLKYTRDYISRDLYCNDEKIDSFDENNIYFIEGNGGEGKSLFLKKFIVDNIEDNFVINIECKKIKQFNSFEDVIYDSLNDYLENGRIAGNISWNKDYFDYIASDHKVIILIDALDELKLDVIKPFINGLIAYKNRMDNTLVICTTRPNFDYRLMNDFKNYKRLRLSKFDDSNIKKIFNSLCLINHKPNINDEYLDFLEELKGIEDDLKYNPLYISAIINEYLIDGVVSKKRIDILEKAFSWLFLDLESSKMYNFYISFNLNEKEWCSLLQFLAFRAQLFTNNAFINYIQEYINDKNIVNLDASKVLEYLNTRSILNKNDFNHVYLKNYLTALYWYEHGFSEVEELKYNHQESIENSVIVNDNNWYDVINDLLLNVDKRLSEVKNPDYKIPGVIVLLDLLKQMYQDNYKNIQDIFNKEETYTDKIKNII